MLDKNFLKNLKHQFTRDLYWLLASHYPLNPNVAHFRLFPEEILLEMVEVHKTFFVELDDYPREFENYLTEKPTRRLGIYAERLMAYFFKHSPYINLITHSFQVIRSGETLGEIDFIIEWKGELYHIELAVKYYLGIDDLNEFKNWIGPSGNDNLSLKLAKALDQQLSLAKEKEVMQLVDGRTIKSYLFLKGKFYTNVAQEELPNWMNKCASRGNYVRLSDAKDLVETSKKAHLLRPNWMSDLVDVQQKNLNTTDVKYLKQQVKDFGGLHLVINENPMTTSFIVLDDWPIVR
jgi:uncharacterized protein